MLVIDKLLSLPEGKTLEFKRDLSAPQSLMKTLTTFSNTAGGKVIIGVGNDKEIMGITEPLSEEERLCNLIADSIAPRIIPNIEIVSKEGSILLIVEVFLSNTRPHYIKSLVPYQ